MTMPSSPSPAPSPASGTRMASPSLWGLLKSRRFGPFFLTQFLGAFNDNVFRQALILLIASGAVSSLAANTLNNVALALFILPFFVFSALAGQVADKYSKDRLIRLIKLAEILIMLAAAIGFLFDAVYFLLAVLFFMGMQSAFFGPIKFSIMPRHLHDNELVAGNALVEAGTFLAILLGSVSGVWLKMEATTHWVAGAFLLAVACAGYLSARQIPSAPASDPALKINWNLVREVFDVMGYARKEPSVWVCVLGISWFWFLGAAYTTQLKVYSEQYLSGTDGLYALLLATFSVGIGLGSVICKKLSGKQVETGLVPLGAIGLSLAGMDVFFSHQGVDTTTAVTAGQFVTEWAGIRVLLDLLLLGLFGGIYIVPLFAYVQHRSDSRYLARIIAANNILNALFMVASAVTGIVLISILGMSIVEFFLVLAGLNLLVCAALFWADPVFIRRFLAWIRIGQGD